MKVYRLECRVSGLGPFTTLEGDSSGAPYDWVNSHEPPHMGNVLVRQKFEEWFTTYGYTDDDEYLPERFRFSFKNLHLIHKCFKGYRNREDLVLKEYTIDTSDKSEYCDLPDGQVIFSLNIVTSCIDIE